MNAIVLEAGALIALERDDRTLWAALKLSALKRTGVVVPSTVVAQVWRAAPSQARLALALHHCVIAPFDPVARAACELCGRAKTDDICDAHVALVACNRGNVLYTSDRLDLRHLLAVHGGRKPKLVRC